MGLRGGGKERCITLILEGIDLSAFAVVRDGDVRDADSSRSIQRRATRWFTGP